MMSTFVVLVGTRNLLQSLNPATICYW